MSNSETENPGPDDAVGIGDDQLPEDLRPSDDNPLAKPLDEDDAELDDLDMDGGKTPDEWDDEQLED